MSLTTPRFVRDAVAANELRQQALILEQDAVPFVDPESVIRAAVGRMRARAAELDGGATP